MLKLKFKEMLKNKMAKIFLKMLLNVE